MKKHARKTNVEEGIREKRWPTMTTFVSELSRKLASWQSYEGHALTIGTQMAFCYLLRCSEYLDTREEEEEGDVRHRRNQL